MTSLGNFGPMGLMSVFSMVEIFALRFSASVIFDACSSKIAFLSLKGHIFQNIYHCVNKTFIPGLLSG